MHAFRESSTDADRDHARKRPRTNQENSQMQRTKTAIKQQRNLDTASALPPAAQVMDPTAMSFEAKIGLALSGSNWQELGSSSKAAEPSQDEVVQETLDFEAAEGRTEAPRELTEKQKKKIEQQAQKIARDAGDVLEVIESDALTPVPTNVTWDQDPELLCCYNWLASTDGTNTIFVPGEPAKWSPPTLPHTLERDSGFQYTDYNYARQPRDPYSPMFHALSVMNPNYQFNDVDVLADRNNLRVLLEFVQGKSNGPFRLDLYLVFNTLIIVRNQSRWWTHHNGQSYGCNFEKFFTRSAKGMEDATSHYRAIKYPMGPLNVVCRFEADAYDDGLVSDELSLSEAAAVSGGLAQRPNFVHKAPIRVLQKGHIVPTAQMVELKTQKHDPERYKPVACQDQLWFGRTSLLFTGPYELNTGVIRRVKCEDATARIKHWEDDNQENLRKLVSLLTQLRAVLQRERRPNRAVVLVRESKGGPLTIRSMEGMSRAVGREFFTKHWPMSSVPHRGGYHGRRGGRGAFNAPRGRGQSYGNQPYANQSYGRQPYNNQSYGNQPRGSQPYNNQSHGGQPYATRGRGFSERRRSPDYGRGGSRH